MSKLAGMLAIAALAAVGAGCGSAEEQNDYVDQVNALQTELVSEVSDITAGAAPTNAQQAAEIPAQMEDAFNAMADDLEAVTPPDDVADLHDQLVAKVREIAGQFADVQDALASGNPQEAAQALTELQTAATQAQTDLNSLIDQINAEFQN